MLSLPTNTAETTRNEEVDFRSLFSDLERSLRNGIQWIDEQYINPDGAWPSYQAADPDAWGGTCLVLYALHESQHYTNQRRLNNAVEWLKNAQLHDGSWWLYKSQNTGSVRATAWALIVLKTYCSDYATESIQDGTQWLSEAVLSSPEGAAWGSTGRSGEDPHIHSTILAVWALNTLNDELAAEGASLLLTVLDEKGGLPKQDPQADENNEAMTALGLFVLSRTGYLSQSDQLFEEAVEWLLTQQDDKTGGWPRYDENWVYRAEGDVSTMDATIEHPTTVWCLLVLLESKLDISDSRVLRTVRAIIAKQDAETGIFDIRGQEHQPIYYSAYCLIGLIEFHDRISSPAGMYEFLEKRTSNRTKQLESQISALQQRFHISLVIITALFVGLIAQITGLLDFIISLSTSRFYQFTIILMQSRNALLIGIVATLAGTIIIVVFRRLVIKTSRELIGKLSDE